MRFARAFAVRAALAAATCLAGCFYDTSGGPAEVDAGDTDPAVDSGVGGLGADCTEAGGECAGYEADFCLYDPTGSSTGVCTITGCLEGGCPGGYTCCDCTEGDYFFVDLCAPDDTAAMLPLAGCTCA